MEIFWPYCMLLAAETERREILLQIIKVFNWGRGVYIECSTIWFRQLHIVSTAFLCELCISFISLRIRRGFFTGIQIRFQLNSAAALAQRTLAD